MARGNLRKVAASLTKHPNTMTLIAGHTDSPRTATSPEITGWRHDTLLLILGAFLAAWWLGWLFHVGTGPVHVLLLAVTVYFVVRLPWRRTR